MSSGQERELIRALVVDDNVDLAENIAELLEALEIEVLLAHDGASAIELMDAVGGEDGIDLAFVDLKLPDGGSGVDLLPELRARSPEIEVIIVTGNATIDSAVRAVRHGIFAYVQKPFEPRDFMAIAERAVAQISIRKESARLARELERSEELHRSLVETVDAAILLIDREGKIVFANPFAQERSPHQRGLEGEGFMESFIEECMRARVLRSLAELAPYERSNGVESQARIGGELRTIRWSVSRGDGGVNERHLAVGIDLTEMRALQRRALEAEALATIGTLTSGLAHEIRNPLNAASLQLELMVRGARRVEDGVIRERLEERVEIVRSELARLSTMLNDFLSLSRPAALAIEERDLGALIESVAALQRPLLEAEGVSLVVELPQDERSEGERSKGERSGGELRARVDEAKIKQALINLIRNASEAIRAKGGGEIVISASARGAEMIEISVADDGPGLSAASDELQKPFMTTKEGGTGLGLAIVRTIVERHGGELRLLGNSPRGAIARFTIERRS